MQKFTTSSFLRPLFRLIFQKIRGLNFSATAFSSEFPVNFEKFASKLSRNRVLGKFLKTVLDFLATSPLQANFTPMDSFAEAVLRRFFQNRPDFFGSPSEYQNFEPDPRYSNSGGYNSSVVSGEIVYRRTGAIVKSRPLLLKRSLGALNFHSESEISHFVNEIFFYSQTLPFFNNFYEPPEAYFPKFFDSCLRIDESAKEAVIVFENLQARGYRLADRESFLSYPHLALMLRKLGNFHAYSFKAKQENAARFRALGDSFVATMLPRFRKSWKQLSYLSRIGLRDLRQYPRYESQLDKVEELLDSVEDFMEQLLLGDRNNFASVLCHGDYLRGNVLFKYDHGEPVDAKIIDMATCVLASPVVDLAQVLYLNADQTTREQRWDDLINEYYKGLTENFQDVATPSREDILAQFRGKSLVAYFVASYFLRVTWSADYEQKHLRDHIPDKYKNVSMEVIPQDELNIIFEKIGGPAAAEAVKNVLKDILDRGFV